MDWLSNKSLHHPVHVAVACIVIGLVFGVAFENYFGGFGFMGRAGAVTVALGVLTFGATAADLLIRAQVGMIADQNGDLPDPYSRRNLRKVMGLQAFVVLFGTLQWGFGDLIWVSSCSS